MPKPPPTPPSSDIEGIHRDRGDASDNGGSHPGKSEDMARKGSRGRPAETKR